MDPYLYSLLQGIYTQLHLQADQLNRMEQTVEALRNEIAELRQQRAVTVDKIEYHFDQLKVEKLDGTLNIGLNPDLAGNIDDLAVNGTEPHIQQPVQDANSPFREIADETHQYLEKEVPGEIISLEQRYNRLLGDDYRSFIVNDIKNQVDERIRYYIGQMKQAAPENTASLHREVMDKVKRDIRVAIERYMNTFPESPDNSLKKEEKP